MSCRACAPSTIGLFGLTFALMTQRVDLTLRRSGGGCLVSLVGKISSCCWVKRPRVCLSCVWLMRLVDTVGCVSLRLLRLTGLTLTWSTGGYMCAAKVEKNEP